MSTYLLELGLEEIPARFIPELIQAIQSQWETTLAAHNIPYETVTVLATYRRLATFITSLSASTAPTRTRYRGPLQSIAQTESGELTQAGHGFLKKNGLSQYVIEIENDKPYIVGYIDVPSVPTTDKIPEMVHTVINAIPLPIAMKWGDNQGPFIRPLHWIVSMLDDVHVPICLFGQSSDTWTRGHRFLSHSNDPHWIASGKRVVIQSAIQYQDTLRSLFVDVDPESRKATITTFLQRHTDEWDSDLVEEVVYLTEWPTPIVGTIDPIYMGLPTAPIVECIRKNQKYFPAIRNGNLTDTYVLIADSAHADNLTQILAGNASVLRARLDDVTFFWNEDQRLTPEIANEKLKKVVYQNGLGSMYDKVLRIHDIATALGSVLSPDPETQHSIGEAALICKADLVSQMVLELPKLQGKMGSIYAKNWGYRAAVCTAIDRLYDLSIPTAKSDTVAFCIGVADRLDTVTSCFKNGLIPTGSQDPWGVRRAALVALQALLDRSQHTPIPIPQFTVAGLTTDSKCRQFLIERLRYILETDYSLPYDIVSAVISESGYLYEMVRSAQALNALKSSNPIGYKQLAETAVRVSRLAAKAPHSTINPALFTTQEIEILGPIHGFLYGYHDTVSVALLLDLTEPITRYFDAVLIMDNNSSIRDNRLALLKTIDQQFKRVGNFESLVI